MTTYTANCERVGDWWEITVPELESGQVTQARSLDDVERVVRDLVVLMTGEDAKDVAVEVRAHGQPTGQRIQRRGLLRRPVS